jgi:predicted Zn-dependent protease
MKWAFVVAALCAVAATSAQDADPKRVDEIMGVAFTRLKRQTDVWFHEGDYPRTIQLLKLHYRLAPRDYDTATNLGFLLESTERDAEALETYVSMRVLNPQQPDAGWPEANFYYAKKAYEKVPPVLERAIRAGDQEPNTFRTLAHAYEKMNMMSDAKRIWELYLAKQPSDLAAKANLTRVLKKLKEGSSKKS